MTRTIIYLIFFCSLTGCAYKDKIPSGIISKIEMQKILWDMILADQYSKQFIIKDSAKKNVTMETMKLYDEVFHIHHITKDGFQKSYQFYIGRPDILKVVFDSLAAQGNQHLQDVYKSVSIPKKSK